ncbi:MAG TPA: chemotaxis protein CheX [Pirellulales bacterium]|nr:chemotaxis protein CheX [Pirellulales bacterium]
MDVAYINPFIEAASTVFKTALNCDIERRLITFKKTELPGFEISGVIGLSGKVTGAVVLSVSTPLAFKVVETLLGTRVSDINADVVDAVGELTNMIAGGAKTALAHLDMSIGLPSVVTGGSHCITFASRVPPLGILFDTAWGPMTLEVTMETGTPGRPKQG